MTQSIGGYIITVVLIMLFRAVPGKELISVIYYVRNILSCSLAYFNFNSEGICMKRFSLLCIIFLLFQGLSFADFSGDTESLIPEDAGIFIKTKKISHLLKTANYIVSELLDSESRDSFNKGREEFRKKTGVDYLNNESLKKCGIDTERPVSFVSYDKDNNLDVMAFLIPVVNEKDFPLKFVEIIKKIRPQEKLDFYPVITDYNGTALYQIQKDIFTAASSGYFIIASTGDLVKKILDRKGDSTGSLVINSDYADYFSKRKKTYDINVFLSGKFIKKLMESVPVRGKSASLDTIDKEKEFLYSQKVMMNTSGESSEEEKKSVFEASMDSVEYASGGIGFDGNKLQVNGSVKLEGKSEYSRAVSALIKTGAVGRMLNMTDADFSFFFSYNLQKLKELCLRGEPWCREYDEIKKEFKNETGVDFEEEFLPAYSGAATVMYGDPANKDKKGDLVIFLSMNSGSSASEIWSRAKNHLSAKYAGKDGFGEDKYGKGSGGFWFKDKSGEPVHIVYDPKGLYIGTSREFTIKALESNTFYNTKNPGRLGRFINPDTYLIFYLRNSGILKSFAAGKGGDKGLYSGPLSRLGEIFIYGEKQDHYYSIDFDIEFR